MNEAFRSIAGLLLYCACMSTPVTAAESPGITVDLANMPDGKLPAGWRAVDGEWRVEKGQLRGEPAKKDGETTLFFGESSRRDVAMEMDVLFEAGRPEDWVGLFVRDGGVAAPGIQFVVHHDSRRHGGIELGSGNGPSSKGWRQFNAVRGVATLADGRRHHLRVEAQMPWVRGFVDGEKVLQSPRGNEASPAGKVGVRLKGGTIVIDHVKVFDLPATQTQPADLAAARTQPLVIAHRGFSWIAPENTLASYRLAMKTKADMAECDVRLTSDGALVLLHDATLERTAGGKGILREHTFEEIRKLDAGGWKAAEFTGERIPTLQELLEVMKGHMRLVIEIKEEQTERQVLEAIHAAGVAPEDVMIFSFIRKAVANIAGLEPLLPTTWLVSDLPYQREQRQEIIRDALRARVSAIGLSKETVDPEFIRHAHSCGLQVFVWTVDEPADMKFLIRIGIDAIITDRPDVLCEILKR